MLRAVKMTRRDFLKRARLAAVLAALGGSGYGIFVEPDELSLERVRVAIPDLPPALEGFKIAQLSDMHLHPFTRIGLIEKAVAMVRGLRPDLVVLTGDFIYTDVNAIDELAPVLAKMNARFGLFGVLGNHDLRKGPDPITASLRKSGIQVLRNQGLEVTVDGAPLHLAGVDSCYGHPSARRALANRHPDTTSLLLVHEPDFADYLSSHFTGVHLQISGHSHGGQIRMPGLGPIILPDGGRKYVDGVHRVKDLQVYTNRGLGTIGLPIRFNCPPQVSEITLIRAES